MTWKLKIFFSHAPLFSRLQQLTKQYSELTKQTTGLSLCHFNKMCLKIQIKKKPCLMRLCCKCLQRLGMSPRLWVNCLHKELCFCYNHCSDFLEINRNWLEKKNYKIQSKRQRSRVLVVFMSFWPKDLCVNHLLMAQQLDPMLPSFGQVSGISLHVFYSLHIQTY